MYPEPASHFIQCPYCAQNLEIILDTSVSFQKYVEDCEVCCRPISLHIAIEDGAVRFVEAFREEDDF